MIKDKTLGFFVKTNGLVSDRIYGGIGISFMLHRVLPAPLRDQYSINRDLAITPESLDSVIRYLRDKGCRFASMDELLDIFQSGRKPKQKLVFFTLDDGYRDNLEYALPVFRRNRVPFTIYVANCFPNHSAMLWWYWLEEKLRSDHGLTIDAPSLQRAYKWTSIQQAEALFPRIRSELKSLPKTEIANTLKKTFDKDDAAIRQQCEAISLTWEEIRQLSADPLVTIGAHTMDHLSLRTLTDSELDYEITASRRELEAKTGKDVLHFAYPYGTHEEAYTREYQAVSKNFKTAVITHRGNISMGQREFPECIPRMALGENTSSQNIDYMLNGITHFGDNGFVQTIRY